MRYKILIFLCAISTVLHSMQNKHPEISQRLYKVVPSILRIASGSALPPSVPEEELKYTIWFSQEDIIDQIKNWTYRQYHPVVVVLDFTGIDNQYIKYISQNRANGLSSHYAVESRVSLVFGELVKVLSREKACQLFDASVISRLYPERND